MKKNAKGVTLIALIVTITIMLIIGSITVQLAFGKEGFLYQSRSVKNEKEKEAEQAKQDLNEVIEYFEQAKNEEGTPVIEKGALTLETSIENNPKNGSSYSYGEEIVYELKVKNTGNITLRNIEAENVIANSVGGSSKQILEVGTIKPEEIKRIKYTYTIKEEDLSGILTNTINVKSVEGVYEGDEEEKSVTTESKRGSLKVVKEESSSPAKNEKYALGEVVIYKITITNNGNITLKDIVLTHALTRPNGTETYPSELTEGKKSVGKLKPGEKKTISYGHTITEDDLGGELKSKVDVQGVPQDETVTGQNVQVTTEGSISTESADIS